jgi:HD-GYP domain-containing protein (c-di-GMP phosphodiesterase class II)
MKPGPLDEDEWELMRLHTEIGERIAAPLVGSARFGPIIRHHHERWDGSGYPDGLAGGAIPRGSRIVAVADVWDALTSARPYRPALSRDEAVAILHAEAGRTLEADTVATFVALVRDLTH